MIQVVCGLILNNNGKILICRRKREKFLEGYWEFPGGKVEEGETPQKTLKRELKEELKMEVEIDIFFATNIHDYSDFTIELISYLCTFIEAEFEMTDHDRFEWVLPKDLLNWKLAPADIPIAKEYIKKVV
ncbi:MAG TPA: (deoxy)nucleoside triphosphate pyrophosphohydrolase [Flavobacteriaceae bacterium]|nr:(deoxy)nucleoside triphosphate pyrophosphohydrolase [Alteromonas sp.]HPF12489.1 (deoxy)nucleoside triphosphate pyrophosphohydrolase [Flavobacteriaceae bacterium]